jgi:metallo-beta-lactamase class B
MKKLLLAALLMAGAASSAELPFAKERIAWNGPQKPFHVVGNIYYVGMSGVSAFLIKTPAGLILTDGGLPESAPFIEQHIKALGFRLPDVKILLNSHAHFDHSGGLAQLKKDTGAKFYASEGDKPFLESGHINFGPSSRIDTTPIHVDRTMRDGDSFTLGGVTMTAHITPGHTKGCTTWTSHVSEGGKTYSVMFFCSISGGGNPLVGNAAWPGIAQAYKQSFARLEKMQTDIFLAPHGNQFGLAAKLARMEASEGKAGAPNPFIDPSELHRFLAQARKDYDTELARQMAARDHKKAPEL